jgi:hypothetical protein
MENLFPRVTVGGVSLSRMIIGSNWILGYSHRGPADEATIRSFNRTPAAVAAMLTVFLNAGVDTLMSPFSSNPLLIKAVKMAEDRVGKKMIIVDSQGINVDDNAQARKEAEKTFRRSRAAGATFCLIHHSSAEQLVNKNRQIIDRLPDYLSMIRDQGLLPGLSAHMPELVIYSDLNGYDVETYIQIYNCLGFMMQVEIEYVNKIIWGARKPVMTIKPMAAGRVTPFVGLNFVWHTIRPCDLVTVGCMTPLEAAEDIEISLASFEGRAPRLQGRSSPNKTVIMKD